MFMLASILFSIVLTIGVNKNKRLYRQQLAKVRARITFFSHFVNTGVRENCGFWETYYEELMFLESGIFKIIELGLVTLVAIPK